MHTHGTNRTNRTYINSPKTVILTCSIPKLTFSLQSDTTQPLQEPLTHSALLGCLSAGKKKRKD